MPNDPHSMPPQDRDSWWTIARPLFPRWRSPRRLARRGGGAAGRPAFRALITLLAVVLSCWPHLDVSALWDARKLYYYFLAAWAVLLALLGLAAACLPRDD